jgi:hypothetical protein
MKKLWMVCGLLVLSFVIGCGKPVFVAHYNGPRLNPNRPFDRALGGAALGAAAGAGIGAAAGNPALGAGIGAAVGGAAGALITPRYSQNPQGGGYQSGNAMSFEEICRSYPTKEEVEACLSGLSAGNSKRATRIQADCEKIGVNAGLYDGEFPQEVADQYESELFKNACTAGLKTGYPQGRTKRLEAIRKNAEGAASGKTRGGGYHGGSYYRRDRGYGYVPFGY